MVSKDESPDSKSRSPWVTVGIRVFIVMILIWLITPIIAYICVLLLGTEISPGIPTFQELGAFGDIFGVTNALFSGLALVGVVAAIFLQSLELKDQKNQFKQQSLDNTFFQMLRLRKDIIEGLAREYESLTGYQFLTNQVESFEKAASSFPADRGSATNLPAYSSWYWPNHERSLDHYYNSLETILVLIAKSDAIAWNSYVLILAGLLSHDEKKLLFYRAVGNKGTQERRFYMLVAKAGLVDDLDSEKWPREEKYRPDLKEMQKKSLLNSDNQPARG